ncbi:MinD/ParA family protein [Rummeliibacillus sp. POC4]|uniref:MinD/ParA family protein n=1 Tax=Rummeliibacillus sp. POC4 TaxID=2305899 RepID=UPI000E660570|nr:MinD/ParA family protein [Rummeliibacillus sp. POC4]RIJ69264.1 MinD/ParA family protein [Rummeliibacillus sp. POC4]
MRDQAESLRMKMQQSKSVGKSIAVVSGKGGVGKSNFTTNFAITLVNCGKKVIIVDMDIGMGNIHILLGKGTRSSLKDYLQGDVTLEQVIYEGTNDLHYISGGTGLAGLLDWSELMFDRLLTAFENLQASYDYILFDMGAGATNWSLDLLVAVEDIIVVSTTEPTSITDAYSMMKYIHYKDREKNFYLLCNRVLTSEEGTDTLNRLKKTMFRFLSKDVFVLGSLPEDKLVRQAVKKQVPFSILYPNAQITKMLKKITFRYMQGNISEVVIGNSSNKFISKLKSIFSKGSD